MNYLNAKFVTLLFLVSAAIAGFAQNEHDVSKTDTTKTVTDINFELLLGAIEGDTVKVVDCIEKGANVNTCSINEQVTPLMYAAQNGHLETVKILLWYGAMVNFLPQNHVGALLAACIAGHVYIADTLIQHGADINSKNLDGVTSLMIAASLNDSVMADMLIFYKANINIQDKQGNSALHYSTFYGSGAVSELLVEKTANLNLKDIHGFTPLMIAAQQGYSYLVDLYIRNGAILDAVNEDNLTALSFAIINNHHETAGLLIQSGADPKHMISGTRNQVSLAQDFGDKDMQEMLRFYGALENPEPIIDKVIVALDINCNLDDFMTGGTVSMMGSKYGLGLEAGYKTRIWVRSVLYEISPATYYQFWESRSVMQLGVNKLFKAFKQTIQNKSGVFCGIHFAYTYGNYRGSRKKPDDAFMLVPKAGVFWNSRSFDVKFNYEYMKYKNTKVSPHRINLSLGFNININKGKLTLKEKPLW